MKILFIRHGRTYANEGKYYCGITDSLLSEGGKKDLLDKKNIYRYPEIKNLKVYTSKLTRTKETLKLLYGDDVQFEELEEFNEINFGDFEGHTYEDLCTNSDFQKWCEGDFENTIPPGKYAESFSMMKKRIYTALQKLIDKQENCIVFCHGGPLAAIYEKYIPLKDDDNFYTIQPDNCEGFSLEFDNKGKFISYTKIPEK